MLKTLLTALAVAACLPLGAQNDVTAYFLRNAGFDHPLNYTAADTKAVAQEILPVEGWTSVVPANYTIVGTYEFGFQGTFNTATVPAVGYDGEAGGGLCLSTGWGVCFQFYQDVTLPAGHYQLVAPTYNGCDKTAATSQLAWLPVKGTARRSTRTSYAANAWTKDSIAFTLTERTQGRIQIGMKAPDGGSSAAAKLVIDYVRLKADLTPDALLAEIMTRADEAEQLCDSTMSDTVRAALVAAIADVRALTAESPTDLILATVAALQDRTQDALTSISLYADLAAALRQAEGTTAMMQATVRAALDEAIAAAQAITTASTAADVAAATQRLLDATAQANTSIAEYNALTATIAAAEALGGDDSLQAAIDEARALATDATATSETLALGVATLEKAMLAYNLAHATEGTGLAPKVKETNPYVATGASEALVRTAMQGANILEKGVCWSTHHEPTVLDDRTTKKFSLNGDIYHIKGMKPETVYYLRAYAMNKTYQVAYGDEIKIVTHPRGTCNGTWNEGAPTAEANTRCRDAIRQTIDYFNEWTGIMGFTLSGHYGSGTPTADCGYGGYMRIGPSAAYQAIGTVLHETGHGVGVGTHWRWYNCTDTRETNGKSGRWLGRAANDALHFLENNYNTDECYMRGDAVHGWGNNATYDWFVNGADKDKHYELQYIGGMTLLHGLFVDGLCPPGYANGIPGYTFNFNDSTRYYLLSRDAAAELGDGLLYQRSASAAAWKPMLTGEEVSDSAAWYLEFDPHKRYYSLRNAATGKYLSHAAGATGLTMKKLTKAPAETEQYQLMPDRTDLTIGYGSRRLTTHGYWLTWSTDDTKALQVGTLNQRNGYGPLTQVAFNYSDAATAQQWIIISEEELARYQAAAISTGITTLTPSRESHVTAIYNTQGQRLPRTQRGINILRYDDGTTRKIIIRE